MSVSRKVDFPMATDAHPTVVPRSGAELKLWGNPVAITDQAVRLLFAVSPQYAPASSGNVRDERQ